MMALRRKSPVPVDGIVRSVETLLDGTALVQLVPRVDDNGRAMEVGHEALIFLNPPKHFDALVGTPIWGTEKKLYVLGKLFGDRVGYNGVRLVKARKQ